MLASASVMALASFGLLPQLLYGSSRCLLSGVRVRAQVRWKATHLPVGRQRGAKLATLAELLPLSATSHPA